MIKAEFKNIGPIKEASLELGDLTVIAGQNNVGKTYFSYALYGFLQFLKDSSFHNLLSHGDRAQSVYALWDKLQKDHKAVISIEEYKQMIKDMVQYLSSVFSGSIHNVFSAPKESFQGADLRLLIEDIDLDSGEAQFGKTAILKLLVEDESVIFKIENTDDVEIEEHVLPHLFFFMFAKMIETNFPDPFILSAERFGISLFYRELDFTKNRLVEELQKMSDDKRANKGFNPFKILKQSARYAQPIKDNIDFTRDLSSIQKKSSKLLIDDLYRSTENMMGGYYKEKNNEIRFISKKRGDGRFDIPLHLASSSARGVSGLYFYLKHVAKPGQLLIIDEPESHLSPTNQILMARLLVFCVNAGLKVLITTHSDYLIKEINNLIMLYGDFQGKDNFLKKYNQDYQENDCVDYKKVKAYVCEDGELKNCTVDERGIDMPVFDKAIDKINAISNTLSLKKINKK